MSPRVLFCKLLLALLALTSFAMADQLTVSGIVTIAPTSIIFSGPVISAPGSTGVFAVLPPSTAGIASNLSIGAEPVGTSFAPSLFITIGGFSFSLTNIDAGTFGAAGCFATPPAPGQMCSPNIAGSYASALDLSNTSFTNSSLAINFSGTVSGPGLMINTPFSGNITEQFTTPFQAYLPSLTNPGPGLTAQFSATLNTTPAAPSVPEPGSMFLLATGLAGLAGSLTRKFKR